MIKNLKMELLILNRPKKLKVVYAKKRRILQNVLL